MPFTPIRADELLPSFAAELGVTGATTEIILDKRFCLGPKLATGGMGVVYLAEDRKASPPVEVVVKFINPEYIERLRTEYGSTHVDEVIYPRVRDRLEREAQSLKKLRDTPHPNVVKVITWHSGVKGLPVPYLVMERLYGQDLDKHIVRRLSSGHPWRMDEILGLARQAAAALRHTHQLGLTHRDIKPSNFFIKAGMLGETAEHHFLELVLIDFGIVKDPALTALTVGGVVPLTILYAADEQRDPDRAEEVHHPCDVFALGIVFAELCFGRPDPFARYRKPGDFPAPNVAGALPGWFRTLMEEMLSDDIAARPTAAEVFARIDNHMPRTPTETGPDSITSRLSEDELNRCRGLVTRAVRSGAGDELVGLLKNHAAFTAAGGQLVAVLLANLLVYELVSVIALIKQAFKHAHERAKDKDEQLDSSGKSWPARWLGWVLAMARSAEKEDDTLLVRQLGDEVEGLSRQFDRVANTCRRIAGGSISAANTSAIVWPAFCTPVDALRVGLQAMCAHVRATPTLDSAHARLELAATRGESKLGALQSHQVELEVLRDSAVQALALTLTRSRTIHVA